VEPDSSPPIAPAATRLASTRLRLARLAAETAIAVPGVVGLHPGLLGRRMTSGGGQRVDGVVVTAVRDGRYEVVLHLVCALVALRPLAERVRAAVLDATAASGLGGAVGPVHVRIDEIVDF